ncbi:DUF2497 domain-containing protein [Henriciella litoralis]|uniref:DUF2497 domain-containing protein n=1 Tax=Henriciella litoralis TaxID=568102 RepID=UPI000A030457|nr:DUF2497 domain-containing protein [Henriciella litoralis]
MADKAQSEPTMEEILASIRKIIADDGDTSQPSSAAPPKDASSVDVSVSDDDDFDDLSLSDVMESAEPVHSESLKTTGDEFDFLSNDDDMPETTAETEADEDMFESLGEPQSSEPATTSAENFAVADDDELEDFDFDAVDLDKDEPTAEKSSVEQALDAISPEWDKDTGVETASADEYVVDDFEEPEELVAPETVPAQVFEETTEPEPAMMAMTEEPAPEPAPEPEKAETDMLRGTTENTASNDDALTDEKIAGVAASALGKLMLKKPAATPEASADPNTLDGLMRELLRPMIKEWLDANLPGIVERKVEEEVQRIARMAR